MPKHIMKKFITFSILAILLQLSLYTNDLKAQLVVEGGQTAEELAEVLIGSGVEISNVVLDCADGASGTFNGEFTSLGMNQGIMLSTGSIQNALGPNDEPGSTVENFTDNDADLDLIASFGTNDACVLEFDVVPFGDTLRFNYVFGSDEYLEFVDQFNDVFAFFISGPGFDGPYSNNGENIALVPGTDIPVSINTINNTDNSEYFVCNGDPNNNCNNYFPEPDFNSTLQYDGLTVVMEAVAAVTPCETYHLKLAIADDLDFSFDSGVFIEAKSLSVDIVTISANTDFVNNSGFDDAVEGCVNGVVTFTRDFQNNQDLVIDYTISGTAINGTDYETIPSSITIPAGQSSYDLIIETINDGIPEGAETVTITYTTNFDCSDEFVQEVTIDILDYEPLVVSNDVTIQPGQTTTLNVSGGGLNYFWNPLYNISDATSQNPTVFPDSTTTYTITSAIGSCIFQESVTVFVDENTCDANAYFMPISICNNDGSVELMAAQTGGSWSGPGVNASGVFSPQSLTPGDYEITHQIYIDADCSDSITQTITVLANPDPFFQAVSLCNSDAPYQLTANSTGGSWSGTGVDANGLFDPSNLTIGTYPINYSVTNANGCNSSFAQNIEVFESGNASFSSSNFCFGDPPTSFIPISSGGTWSGTGINQDGVFNPQGLATGTYPVTYTIGSGTCQNSSTQYIRIIENPNSNFAAISLCSQSAPTQLQAEVLGGSWSGTGVSSTGIFDPTGLQAGNYEVTYSLTNADGCSSSSTQNISILNQIDAGFQAASFCINNPPTQLVAVTAGGNWSGSGVDQNGIFYPNNLSAGTYAITHYFDGANNCGGSFSTEISVYELPDASFSNRTVCADVDTIHLNPSSQGGTWEGIGINADGIFQTTGLAPGTYDISYSVVNEFGCENSTTGTVTIIETPNSDFENINICVNAAPIQLTANTAGGVWIGTGISYSGIFDPTGLPVGNYNISHTAVNEQGCSSVSQGFISIIDGSDSSFENQSVCANSEPIQLIANTAGGVWSGTGVSNNGIFNPTGLPSGNYEITHSITNAQNCNSSSVGIITILEAPSSSFEIFSICENAEPIQLTADTEGGTWSGTGISTDGIFNPNGLQAGDYNITYTITNAQGCSSTSQEIISILDTPISSFEYQWFCSNSTPNQLVAYTEGGVWAGTGVSIDGIFDPNGLQIGNYDITHTVTNAQGCSSTSQGIVSIVDNPNSDFEYQWFCSDGTPTQLTAVMEGGIWTGTGISTDGIFDPNGLQIGNYDITHTVMNADGCSSTSQGIVSIVDNPDSDFEYQWFCLNGSPNQLIANTESGFWSGIGVSPDGIFNPTGLQTGNYDITHTIMNADGCSSTSQGIVSIVDSPDSSFENQLICSNDGLIQLTANTEGGTWSGLGISSNGVFDPTGLTAGDYEISYTLMNADGCTTSSNGIVTILETPNSDFENQAICTNAEPVQLIANTEGGTWSGTGISNDGVFDPNGLDIGDYDISYTIINAEGCSSTSFGMVTISENPNGTFENIDICTNSEPIQLTANTEGGTWVGTGVSNNGIFDPNGLDIGDYDISYTVVNSEGCTNTTSGIVTILENPNSNFENINICQNAEPVQLTANIENGIWSGNEISSDGTFDPNGLASGDYDISYTVMNENGCSSTSIGIVTILENPNSDFENINICQNAEPIQLNANTEGGTWAGTGVSNDGIFDPNGLTIGDYDVSYTVVNADGCSSSTDGVISIVSSPDTNFSDLSICDDGSLVQLTAATAGGTWSGVSIDENGLFDSSIGVGTYEITYSIDNQDGCQNTSTGNIVVNPNPDSFFQGQNFCENDPIFQFSPVNSGGEWSGAVDENGIFDPSVGPGVYSVTYTFTNESGCSSSHSIEILVSENLDADFEIENEIICLGNSSILTPINTDGTWSGIGIDENGIFDSNELETGTYEITYTIESLDGCISSVTKEVTVVSIPDASFESATTVCSGDSILLTATNANGVWSGIGINEDGLFSSIGLEAGDYEISYTITNENGCENSFTNSITIPNDIPFGDYDFNCIGGEGFAISFDIPNDGDILLSIYNGNSELVSEIENEPNSYELYFVDEPFSFVFTNTSTGCESEYSFTVDDCVTICDAYAGEITLLDTELCGADTIRFEHFGDPSESVDTLLYIVLDNPDVNQANILASTNEHYIILTDIFQYNITYYLVAFNGYLDENNNPLIVDTCFDISEPLGFNFTQPINVDFEIDCDPETAVFEVLYTITGGSSSFENSFYTVSGDVNIDVDDEIKSGDQISQIYTDGDYINLIVSDSNGCFFEISEGPISCAKCGTEAGIISTEPIFVCEEGTVQNEVTDYSQFGLPLVYIVHTDVNNPPGEMLAVKPWTSYGEFSFDDLNPDLRAYNTQYYISAYIGPLDEAGFPDFDDLNNCTVFMPGAPVVWIAPFEILIETNCADDNNFEFIINFEGQTLGSDVYYTININDGAFTDVFDEIGPYVSPSFEAGGNNYFVEISIGGQCIQTFQITNFDCTPGLAIEMISFDGYKNGRTNKLVWQTATEYQNKYFSIQRSLNGIDFTEIGTVDAIGNSNQLTSYSFEDTNCNSKSWYYRLETFDINNKSEFTETIYLPRSIRNSNIIDAIYPNPVSNSLFIDINTNQIDFAHIKLVDVNGKILFNESAKNINSILKIDVSHFATGVYFLQIQSDKETVVEKILVE